MHTVLHPRWNKSIVDLVLADKEELIADLKSHGCLGTSDCYLSVFTLCKQNMASVGNARSFRRARFFKFKQLEGWPTRKVHLEGEVLMEVMKYLTKSYRWSKRHDSTLAESVLIKHKASCTPGREDEVNGSGCNYKLKQRSRQERKCTKSLRYWWWKSRGEGVNYFHAKIKGPISA